MLSFKSIKALAQAAVITQARSGYVGLCEENKFVKQSPEKKLLETTLTTKMAESDLSTPYDTRPCDMHLTLVDK